MPHAARATVTLHDVAAAAGVSVSTASRVLSGSARKVAPEYEARVLAAAAELRYTVDASARAMKRASDSIALIADDLSTPSIALAVAEMERHARRAGAFVTVSETRRTVERQFDTVRLLRSFRPRALVLTSSRFDSSALGGRLLRELLAYQREGGRIVIVGSTDMPFDSIGFDDHGAGLLMGAHIRRTGHRDVAILAGQAGAGNLAARTAGFVEGMTGEDRTSPRIRVVECEVSRQGGVEATSRLIAEGLGGTDAILAVNDLVAIGALAALRAAGVSVPGQLSVTGIDDVQLSSDVTPRLTTVALPLAHVGAESIRLALDGSPEIRALTVQGSLIVRDSTRHRDRRD